MWNLFGNANPNRHFRDVLKSGFNETNKNLLVIKASLEDFNTGSKVRVDTGEIALLVEDGQIKDILHPSTTPVETKGHFFLSNMAALIQGGERDHACAVYYMRTTTPDPLFWGLVEKFPVEDPFYNNFIAYVGGGGSLNIKIPDDIINIQKFFTTYVGGGTSSFSYEDFIVRVQEDLNEEFRNEFCDLVQKKGKVEGHILSEISRNLKPSLEKWFEETTGLKLSLFTVNRLIVDDSEERKQAKQLKVNELAINQEDIKERKAIEREDIAGRNAIDRDALSAHILEVAKAQGQAEAIKALGPNWLKVTTTELLKTLANNPGVANMAAGAFGGYLGSQPGVIDSILSAAINGFKGDGLYSGNAFSSVQEKSAIHDTSTDPFAPVATKSYDTPIETVSSIPSYDQKETLKKLLRDLKEELADGIINHEEYETERENLKRKYGFS